MSRKYLTRAQVATKLGTAQPANPLQYATKAYCVSCGASTAELNKYTDNMYPVDDDIVGGNVGMNFRINVSLSKDSFTRFITAGQINIYYNE